MSDIVFPANGLGGGKDSFAYFGFIEINDSPISLLYPLEHNLGTGDRIQSRFRK